MDGRRATLVFAVLASVCFATQHPLSKPFVDSAQSAVFVMAVSAGVSLLSAPALFVFGNGGRGCRALLRGRANWVRLTVLAVMGGLAAGAYVIGFRGTHTAFVALVLNTSPLWAGAWTRMSAGDRRPLPKAFFATVALALAAILVSGMLSRRADPGAASFSAVSLLLFLVPATWTLRALLALRWFPEGDTPESDVYEVTAALTLVSSGMLLGALGLYALWDGGLTALIARIPLRQWVELAIGTTAGATLGVAFYLKAVRLSDDQTYVTVFNLLIPFMSGAFAWLLTWVEPGGGLAPEPWPTAATACVLLILGYFAWCNREGATRPH